MIIALLQVRIICAACGTDFNYNTRVDGTQSLHVPFTARFASRTAGWDTEGEGDEIRDVCPKCKGQDNSVADMESLQERLNEIEREAFDAETTQSPKPSKETI